MLRSYNTTQHLCRSDKSEIKIQNCKANSKGIGLYGMAKLQGQTHITNGKQLLLTENFKNGVHTCKHVHGPATDRFTTNRKRKQK